MKIFVAGATGVLGRELVPQLVARGHEVVGMTRSSTKEDLVRSLGARPAIADALDPDAVAHAVASAEPEVIVHELTALSGEAGPRQIDRFFETTTVPPFASTTACSPAWRPSSVSSSRPRCAIG